MKLCFVSVNSPREPYLLDELVCFNPFSVGGADSQCYSPVEVCTCVCICICHVVTLLVFPPSPFLSLSYAYYKRWFPGITAELFILRNWIRS
jgi:hypothetical protein